jgi:hypothetical protein
MQQFAHCIPDWKGSLSYHIRNVLVFSTIEMSPGCWFMLLQKSCAHFFIQSLVSRDDWRSARFSMGKRRC